MNGHATQPEEFRPEEMPPHHPLTLREMSGLAYEKTNKRVPPKAFYLITQLIYFFQGLHSTFIHITLCETFHQMFHYRHKPSDQYLRAASWCRECVICPNWVYEHFHLPSKKCTVKCSARPVYRPPLVIKYNAHECREHICSIPLWYHRQNLPQYPELAYSPFYATFDHFRISRQIAQNGVKPLVHSLVYLLQTSDINKEEIISLESLFL